MNHVRDMAVAGLFYPSEASEIQRILDGWLLGKEIDSSIEPELKADSIRKIVPRALILPHAGFVYSGKVAAQGYQLWTKPNSAGLLNSIKTIVVMGPAHHAAFEGITTVDFDALKTPLGDLKVDSELRDRLLKAFNEIQVSNFAHAKEHSIEVHLPFIKYLSPNVKVLPLLNGQVSAETVSRVLASLWQQEGVYFVISSDLSHFHTYEQAQKIDGQTATFIDESQWQSLTAERACGYKGIQGLLNIRAYTELKTDLNINRLQVINSGDSAGDKSRVVGYGAWAVCENGCSLTEEVR